VVLVVTDPLWGAGRAHPLMGRAVTRLSSLGRAGRSWDDSRLCVGLVDWECRFLVTDRSFKGGGELEIVERFLDDDEGLEAVARFLGRELEPERRVAPLEV
jgi:hypothetical protein